MLSKGHLSVYLRNLLYCSLGDVDQAIEQFEENAPFVILPDAIRCFSFGDNIPNNRVITHFEKNPFNGETSWLVFPTLEQIKVLDEEIIAGLPKSYAEDYHQVAVGDESQLDVFEEKNFGKTDKKIYVGCHIHLAQDIVYDEEIRKHIDCKDARTNGGYFFFKGKKYDAKSVRKLISEIEEIEFRVLCELIKMEFDVEVNSDFFEKHVKTALERAYCPRMAESTWKYINFSNEEIPPHITRKEAEETVERLTAAF